MPTLSEIIQGSGLTLSELDRRSGVRRVTLSRIVNGHQAMSRATAKKLEPILGVSAEELLQPVQTRPAAPEILRVTADQIRQWGNGRPAEGELPELVSRLIRSELAASGFIRAPSDERIVESGPDVKVDAPRATRHIPRGRSVWEVSTEKAVRAKATEDLKRRQAPAGWQFGTTSWIFVTTEPWPGKDEWTFQQQAEHPWRSIQVLDATDLKSWIDESPGVQVWLMGRMGRNPTGLQWLREAVQEWCSTANPPITTALLKSSVEKQFAAWCDWIRSRPNRPLGILGESTGEALLFLQALLEHGGSHLSGTPIEGLCVNTKEGLRQLLQSPPSDVIVVPTTESVRELAVAHCGPIRVALPEAGQPRVRDPLKVLPAGRTAVQDFLVENDIVSGLATQLARSCGGSISILRRLTNKGGPQALGPKVSNRKSRILAGAGLFGAWDAGSKADCEVVRRLTGQKCDERVDEAWKQLLNLPETPVWMDGGRRGVNSRLDTWQRFTEGLITPHAIDRFFDAVTTAFKQVPLERPGQSLLTSAEYQALRDSQVSAELLQGLARGLILLAEFGESIDPRLLGDRVATRVANAVFEALDGMTVDRLRALSEIVPLLAESAPEAFLAAMEADLGQSDSAQKALLNFRWDASESERPLQLVQDTEAMHYRTPLMWAYEILAWFPDYAERAIDLLGQLADEDVHDQHGGQPRQSLAKLLQPWNRGSVLDAERHCAVLRKLARDHPEWAFDLARQCFRPGLDTTGEAHLPLWRGQSDAAESEQSEEHQEAVYRTAADILVQYAETSERTIHAAIDVTENLLETDAARIWERIASWSASENRSNEEHTRLVRYLTSFTEVSPTLRRREADRKRAGRVLEELSAVSVTAPDLWLFKDDAVIWEHRQEDEGWEVTNERLDRKRRSALQRVWKSGGVKAILSIVPEVTNTRFIGQVASCVLSRDEINLTALQALQVGGDAARSPMRGFVQGLLAGMDDLDADTLVDVVRSSAFAEENPNWLPCLLARFTFGIGTARTDGLSPDELIHYWQQFDSEMQAIPPERKDWLIAGLCSVKRPRAALKALWGDFLGARTESLRKLIHTLPQSKEQNSNDFEHWEHKLVAEIRDRPDLSSADAASIEFMFFDILEPDEMPALAKVVASDPSWFQEALMLCTERRDGEKDHHKWNGLQERAFARRRRRARQLFRWLPMLPGTMSKRYDVDAGAAWTTAILSFAEQHDRREAAETLLGHAFGNAGFHEDGSPTDDLTNILEQIKCPGIERGIAVAVGNRFGSVALPEDEAGRPYRTRAEAYRKMEERYRDSAPCMTRVMRHLRHRFDEQGRQAEDHRRLDEHLDAS